MMGFSGLKNQNVCSWFVAVFIGYLFFRGAVMGEDVLGVGSDKTLLEIGLMLFAVMMLLLTACKLHDFVFVLLSKKFGD